MNKIHLNLLLVKSTYMCVWLDSVNLGNLHATALVVSEETGINLKIFCGYIQFFLVVQLQSSQVLLSTHV